MLNSPTLRQIVKTLRDEMHYFSFSLYFLAVAELRSIVQPSCHYLSYYEFWYILEASERMASMRS